MNWLPDRTKTSAGEARRVGIEIELAGISPEHMLDAMTSMYGGEAQWLSAFEIQLRDTELGDFKLELDSQLLKRMAKGVDNLDTEKDDGTEKSAEQVAFDLISRAAEQLVPWEIVTAPIPIKQIERLVPLINTLREGGAKGTHYAARFAFGVHLNPELPDLKAKTILSYLRAYLALYPLILEAEGVDLSRRITPYINHFGTDYQKLVLDENYSPNMQTLIDDYLQYNPTRNRSLDLLPLFSHIDESRVSSVVDDDRVKSRPTFHYRLPNCDIDNPDWNLDKPWQHWLWIEWLANDSDKLASLGNEFYQEVSRLTYHIESKWPQRAKEFVEEHYHSQ